jgi:hypothetical protein
MSWSLQVEPRPVPDIYDAIQAAEPSAQLSEESLEQVHQAKAQAITTIKSGAIGDEGQTFSVSLSGHANPGHAHQEGMADDYIQVSVGQRPASKEATG